MVLVSEKCAHLLKCKVSALRDRLRHPADRAFVMAKLNGRTVRTTYEDRNGFKKSFTIGGLTQQGADALMAYGRLPRPFAVCVAAYYYTRHRIKVKMFMINRSMNVKLHHPYHVCIIERFPDGAEDRYFPLELLELVDDFPLPIPSWLGANLFAELPIQEKADQGIIIQ